MTTTTGVKTVVCVIFATALMASCAHGADIVFSCEAVNDLEGLMAVKPASQNLTLGPLGVYSIISSTECYVLNVNQPDFAQRYPSLFQLHKGVSEELETRRAAAVACGKDGCGEKVFCSNWCLHPTVHKCLGPCHCKVYDQCNFHSCVVWEICEND
jgi:hypothetical protein